MKLYHVEMLHLLWLLPALISLLAYGAWRRRTALEKFAANPLLLQLNNQLHSGKRLGKHALLLAAVAFIVIGLARPAWNPQPQIVNREGRDVVFIVDVSRSMLAEDLAPNRLERAKLAIRDCLEGLSGDRVGLIAFAGTSVVKCPLTLDYGFFRMMLEDIGPDEISRGGTLIGDALRKALTEVFDEQEKEFRDIILITDGDDQESFPMEAAKQAGEAGIRIIAIGLGNENQGERIPVVDSNGRKSFLTYQGEEVWTRLDAATLREVAAATPDGKYLNVATGAFDLNAIYQEFIASARKKALDESRITLYDEKFQIFLAAGFLLLCAETLLTERRRQST
ncbi:MAG: VWA domain-containing protein [Candidatus Hydrogenedentes bacterium]|nr:VWA domain-containing protein [Candidatus Hydrogenedentota bacterium]